MTKFAYSKQEGTIEIGEGIKRKIVPSVVKDVPMQMFGQNPGYEKAYGEIEPKLYFVISGGTKREKNFLSTLIYDKSNSFPSLKLIFLTTKEGAGGLTPNMMYQEYNKILSSGIISYKDKDLTVSSIDDFYMITDVDHYYEELKTIMSTDNSRCKWIISNPDFEVWLYYCFFCDPEKDLRSIVCEQPSKRSTLMKQVNASLMKGGIDPRKAFMNMHVGIKNAKAFYQEDEFHIPLLLSTNMWKFCEDIDEIVSCEFSKWLKAKTEKTC